MAIGKTMIKYDNLVCEARRCVPAFANKYDELIRDDYLNKDSGNHVVFGYAFAPVLIDAIQKHDDAVIKDMFVFLERMSNSDDNSVVEVCDQSVLEALNDEIDDNILLRYMGPKTKEGFEAVKTYMF